MATRTTTTETEVTLSNGTKRVTKTTVVEAVEDPIPTSPEDIAIQAVSEGLKAISDVVNTGRKIKSIFDFLKERQ